MLRRWLGWRAAGPALAPVRPLVLIHGMSSGPAAWDPVLELLSESREVHVLTLPGHRGGLPLEDPARFTSQTYVDAMEAELDRRGIERADLVGNSLGGWVALQLAGRGRASSVVCLAPAGGWRPGGAFDRFLAAQFGIAYRACVRLSRSRPRVREHPAVRAALLRPMVARPDLVDAAAYRELIADIAGCDALAHSLYRPATRDVHEVPPIDCPVLIAWSANDRILVSATSRRRLVEQIDRAQVVQLPGVGHVPMSDAPDRVAEMILAFTAEAASRPAGST